LWYGLLSAEIASAIFASEIDILIKKMKHGQVLMDELGGVEIDFEDYNMDTRVEKS